MPLKIDYITQPCWQYCEVLTKHVMYIQKCTTVVQWEAFHAWWLPVCVCFVVCSLLWCKIHLLTRSPSVQKTGPMASDLIRRHHVRCRVTV